MGSGASSLPERLPLTTFKDFQHSSLGDDHVYATLAKLADTDGVVSRDQLLAWASAAADDADKRALVVAFQSMTNTMDTDKNSDTVAFTMLPFEVTFEDEDLEAITALDMGVHTRPLTAMAAVASTADSASAVARLAASDVRAARKLGDQGMCENLLHVIELNTVREELVRESLRAIVAIAKEDELTAMRLGEDARAGTAAYDVLLSVFGRYGAVMPIVDAACQLYAVLSAVEDNRTALGASELIVAATKAVSEYCLPCDVNSAAEHGAIVENYCRAVAALARGHQRNRKRLGKAGVADHILLGMRSYIEMVAVQIHALKALNCLAEQSPTNRNLVGNNPLMVPAIYWAMENYTKVSVPLTEDALCLTIQLCESEKYRRRLGDGDIGEVVFRALAIHGTDRSVTALCCKAVAMLLARMPDTRVKFGACGFCEAVVGASMRFQTVNDGHIAEGNVDSGLRCSTLVVREALDAMGHFECTHEELIAGHACDAIAWLAYGNQPNKSRLRDAGALSVVMEALRGFCWSLFVVERGCRAVCELAKDHDANKTSLGEGGAAEFLMIAVRAHQTSPRMAEECLRAVGVLTHDHPANRHRFGALAACTLFVVDAMRSHLDYHSVAELGAAAVANLALSPENIPILDGAGAVPALYGAMVRHKVVAGVLVACCRALTLLAASPSCRGRMADLGVFERLKETHESEKSGKDVRFWAAQALEAVAKANARRRSIL